MRTALANQLTRALTQFSSATRLYRVALGDGTEGFAPDSFLVEAFAALDAVDEIGARDLIVLSISAHIVPGSLLGRAAHLDMALADGSLDRFSGEVSEVAMLGSDGGFARYRVRISPWFWRLGQVRNSRVWQERTVIEIVDAVLAHYRPLAIWRWSRETSRFMEGARPRSYCCQYRESDLDFVRRLLAEEGLSWRFEQTGDGPGLVLFSDSTDPAAVPADRSCETDGAICCHGSSAVERQDTVQALVEQRRLQASLTSLLSPDYKSKQVVTASSPSLIRPSPRLPLLESCDAPGQYAYASREQARRHADVQMEGKEARTQPWHGRSTVRTLRAGTRLLVTGVHRMFISC